VLLSTNRLKRPWDFRCGNQQMDRKGVRRAIASPAAVSNLIGIQNIHLIRNHSTPYLAADPQSSPAPQMQSSYSQTVTRRLARTSALLQVVRRSAARRLPHPLSAEQKLGPNETSTARDAAAIRQLILSQLDKRNDVVVTMHSYGQPPPTASARLKGRPLDS